MRSAPRVGALAALTVALTPGLAEGSGYLLGTPLYLALLALAAAVPLVTPYAFDYDLAMVNSRTNYLMRPESFSRRRLYQVLGVAEVASVSPVYTGHSIWRDPTAREAQRERGLPDRHRESVAEHRHHAAGG